MAYPLYQVDAFADAVFEGNPAAVMPLNAPLDEDVMQRLAQENNLSETAFLWPEGDAWRIRWFTPSKEVPLCGHATLASAHVLWRELHWPHDELRFNSASGELRVRKVDDLIELNFPALMPKPAELSADVAERLELKPQDVRSAIKELVVLASEAEVAAFSRDFSGCESLESGVILTARSDRDGVDFVSRFFGGPEVGIKEDPVTGSAHAILVPYWAEKLGKSELVGRQISSRPGQIECVLDGDRVRMRGQARTYLRGFVEWT
ncbi:PhzF family phenazine biosynthesis protein [Saccharospirillum salsuginis]|uniref:Isomerase n=1 Tax=Saccharospirillum salsuginis TaxID=418750 RepID=A0A918KJ93_9GAMM|nr:PhzF family phenazine biosynthesis protein [Saccharospirillum salsuginis]GGX63268.1 putative isomerase [Saccharospirillum salsuginis]